MSMTLSLSSSLVATPGNGRSLLFGLVLLAMPLGASAAEQISLRADTPQRYTVVEGDTLWDIAGQFLEEPWLWPEVWQINPQIDNPDLIYPGDIIELAYVDGAPVLRLSRADNAEGGARAADADVPAGLRTVRLSPQVRRELLLSPVPAIPLDLISSYFSENSVVSATAFDIAPYLLGEREGRTMATTGDEVLARGQWATGVITYDIVRKGRELMDPDDSDAMVGLEAIFVGTATITRTNNQEAVMTIDRSIQEVRAGDRLIPRESVALNSTYMPRPPPFAVNAAIVSIGSGNSIGGLYDTLILNTGQTDGIEVGQVLTLQEPALEMVDTQASVGPLQRLKQVLGFADDHRTSFPGANIGTVLIYRVFDDASLGLVLKSNNAVRLNDRAVTP
jgi:hypothetical protein